MPKIYPTTLLIRNEGIRKETLEMLSREKNNEDDSGDDLQWTKIVASIFDDEVIKDPETLQSEDDTASERRKSVSSEDEDEDRLHVGVNDGKGMCNVSFIHTF